MPLSPPPPAAARARLANLHSGSKLVGHEGNGAEGVVFRMHMSYGYVLLIAAASTCVGHSSAGDATTATRGWAPSASDPSASIVRPAGRSAPAAARLSLLPPRRHVGVAALVVFRMRVSGGRIHVGGGAPYLATAVHGCHGTSGLIRVRHTHGRGEGEGGGGGGIRSIHTVSFWPVAYRCSTNQIPTRAG